MKNKVIGDSFKKAYIETKKDETLLCMHGAAIGVTITAKGDPSELTTAIIHIMKENKSLCVTFQSAVSTYNELYNEESK